MQLQNGEMQGGFLASTAGRLEATAAVAATAAAAEAAAEAVAAMADPASFII